MYCLLRGAEPVPCLSNRYHEMSLRTAGFQSNVNWFFGAPLCSVGQNVTTLVLVLSRACIPSNSILATTAIADGRGCQRAQPYSTEPRTNHSRTTRHVTVCRAAEDQAYLRATKPKLESTSEQSASGTDQLVTAAVRSTPWNFVRQTNSA